MVDTRLGAKKNFLSLLPQQYMRRGDFYAIIQRSHAIGRYFRHGAKHSKYTQ